MQDLLTRARTRALTIGDGRTCSGGDAGYFCTYDGMSKESGATSLAAEVPLTRSPTSSLNAWKLKLVGSLGIPLSKPCS
jgi:hypothetical protein